jgi:hypothetical protein
VQVADVSKLAEERSITAAQLSLAWVASQVSFTRRGHETKRSDAIRDTRSRIIGLAFWSHSLGLGCVCDHCAIVLRRVCVSLRAVTSSLFRARRR